MPLQRIASFGLALPRGWQPIPPAGARKEGWSEAEAERILPQGADSDVVGSLAQQLRDAADALTEAGMAGMRGAVLVRESILGIVDAMAAVMVHPGVRAERFAAELAAALETEESWMMAEPVETSVAAGDVVGAQIMLAHLDPSLGEGVGALEERAVLGVFPQDTNDMVETTVIARSVGSFDDIVAETVRLLGGLRVILEPVA